jgi:hypothetical protein
MPHLQRQREQAALKDKRSHTDSSTFVQKPQVKDVGSLTRVGSLSRRIASGTALGPLEPHLKDEVIAVAKKKHAEAGQEQPRDLVEGTEWKKGPTYLQLTEKERKIKTDIVEGAKELPEEEEEHQGFQQKQGSGNRTPGITKFTTISINLITWRITQKQNMIWTECHQGRCWERT